MRDFTAADLYDNTPEDNKKFMEERIVILLEYLANSRNEITMLNGENNYLKNKLKENGINY
tara:strand:- start:1139 stop:1321 length:183 start_codon:yes stop_codon:yes gene_type:complete